jgi:hypothetical protein
MAQFFHMVKDMILAYPGEVVNGTILSPCKNWGLPGLTCSFSTRLSYAIPFTRQH